MSSHKKLAADAVVYVHSCKKFQDPEKEWLESRFLHASKFNSGELRSVKYKGSFSSFVVIRGRGFSPTDGPRR